MPREGTIGQPAPMEKELAQRESDGISVTLVWHSVSGRLSVSVSDWRTGEAFDLDASARNALDVFRHPFAYAAVRGLLAEAASEPVYA
jgi:hypothetical protein